MHAPALRVPSAAVRPWDAATTVALHVLAIFASAFLLFFVQPMFARMALPTLGGTPAVWNTALVFFQAALLGGYAYAHWAAGRFPLRVQAALHLGVLLAAAVTLPLALPAWSPPAGGTPMPWLLALMAVSVGLPFFALSATSPLLQHWFSRSGHRSGRDPYWLYVASNGGSFLALFAYPLLVEPRVGLEAQARAWSWGFAGAAALVAGCGAAAWATAAAGETRPAEPVDGVRRLPAARRLRWLALAAVPSSLMVGVTTYLTTEIAAIPLLWVLPLGLYLLTFTLTFARRALPPRRLVLRVFPMTTLLLAIPLAARANDPAWLILPLHLLAFFVAAMVAHGALADDRPGAERLTEFYLWMALGGVAGGAFAGLLAPLVFETVAEYPLTLVAACLLAPATVAGRPGRRDVALPLLLAAGTAGCALAAARLGLAGPAGTALALGLPALVCFGFAGRPVRFGLGLAALLAAGSLTPGAEGAAVFADRSFYGVNRVARTPDGTAHLLIHGNTLHGMQFRDPSRRRTPLAYYHPDGPVGGVFAAFAGGRAFRSVGVVGLGAGALACYRTAGQRWTFYEIDPAVVRIARDPALFSYLRDCAPDADVVVGDARLSLADAPPGAFDLLVLDAYSSDAIPVHLLTREAVALYRGRLAPGGLLAFHASNDHFDLEPVLAALARDAGWTARVARVGAAPDAPAGLAPSEWVVMAASDADLGPLAADPAWRPLVDARGAPVWTDDHSSVLRALRWWPSRAGDGPRRPLESARDRRALARPGRVIDARLKPEGPGHGYEGAIR